SLCPTSHLASRTSHLHGSVAQFTRRTRRALKYVICSVCIEFYANLRKSTQIYRGKMSAPRSAAEIRRGGRIPVLARQIRLSEDRSAKLATHNSKLALVLLGQLMASFGQLWPAKTASKNTKRAPLLRTASGPSQSRTSFTIISSPRNPRRL